MGFSGAVVAKATWKKIRGQPTDVTHEPGSHLADHVRSHSVRFLFRAEAASPHAAAPFRPSIGRSRSMALFGKRPVCKHEHVRVLVVDDSAIVRSIIKNTLATHPSIEVVGLARDGVEALNLIARLRPDVVTLDVEMPRMNGIGVLERAAGKLPISFLMISTLTQTGGQITMEALRKGAFDYIPKPESGALSKDSDFRKQLIPKVFAAAKAKGRVRKIFGPSRTTSSAAPKLPPNKEKGWVVAIGISCGGPQTLTQMLPVFPSDFVPIVITQHMPAQFTRTFAKGLNDICACHVEQAEDGQPLQPGKIIIAPGDAHLKVVRRGVGLVVQLDRGAKVAGHRPSADVMFSSVARACANRSIGVIMTGMGHDGAAGIQELHGVGAWTIAQDEATSLVYGMPKVAVETGCVTQVSPLMQIPQTIARFMRRGVRPQTAGV